MYLQIQEAYHGLINMIGVSQAWCFELICSSNYLLISFRNLCLCLVIAMGWWSMFWLAKVHSEERAKDVDIRAQLAARVFLHEVMEGLKSWPDLLPGLSDAALQYLHAILTYEAWQSLVGTLWIEFLVFGSGFGGTGCCKEPCASRAPSKMAGTTGIMSVSKGYSVKAWQLRQGMSCGNVLSWAVWLPAEQVGWSGWFVLSTAWGPNCVRRMWQAGWQQEMGTWVVIRTHDLNSLCITILLPRPSLPWRRLWMSTNAW